MTKFAIIILGIFYYAPQVFGTWPTTLISGMFEHIYTNVVRVRSLEKLAQSTNELAVLDFMGLVEQYEGYTTEEYDVETSDGYILKLHRVTGSPLSPAAYGKPVVYFGLGLFASSDVFAFLGPQQALLFMLADAGFDVWLGNYRGTAYSKRHIKYSAESNNLNFWKFSVDEMALIDLPLFIDTVLEKTNKKKLSYVGISMGNTLSAMLLSDKPEYNEKMHVVVNIGPVILFTPPYSSVFASTIAWGSLVKDFAVSSKIYQAFPQSKLLQIFGKDICIPDSDRSTVCERVLNNLGHSYRLNRTVIPTTFKYYPAGASIFTVDQYFQFAQREKFARYDYGVLENIIKYGSPTPPEYDLTKVTSPQALIYSETDVFSNAHDVETLNRAFPNVIAFEKVFDFNHLDFVFADAAKNKVYKRTVEIINDYSND